MIRDVLVALALTAALFTPLPTTLFAWEDHDIYTQRDAMRQQEQDHTDRLNREDRQRTEDYHRQQSREYEDRRRSEELRTYNRTDRDGSSQLCSSTRYSTVCN